ncbi:MAG: Gfo/Idh/MocA family oxidoreductase [Candidatus Sumerlaeota bacterium]|nr:Gfo/Idh/MocA family oxidoreductase [Candidatus Sumerlaeota bacterium]
MITTRRKFIATAATALAAPYFIPARVLGRNGFVTPSERIVLGAIGIGPRGRHDLTCFLAESDVQFVAICDVQRSSREAVKAMADAKYGNKDCVMYRDMFELLARPDIDAVLVATGDHWHTMGSILSARAGKDVYSEKPCGITIGQVQALDDTMRRLGRVFQAGTQRRSISNFQFAVNLVHSGKLGKVHTMHASSYRPKVRFDWLPAEPEPPIEECDWDRWLGPSPWRPYNKQYVEGRWRGHYDFDSGATILDWAAHTMDLCQWANQSDGSAPLEFEPTKDNITARYANGVKLVIDFLDDAFGNRDPQYRTSTGTCPVRFVGDEGWIETGDSGEIITHPASLKSELRAISQRVGTDAGSHGRNFLDCVKSRLLTACNSRIMRSSHIACHAAAMAWELGRKLKFDPVKEEFIADEEANRLRTRAMREPWSL